MSTLIFDVDDDSTVSIDDDFTVLIDDVCILPISSYTSIYATFDEDFIFCISFYNNTSLSEAYTGKFTLIAFLLHGIPQEELVQVGELPVVESSVELSPVVEASDKGLGVLVLMDSSNSPSAFRVIILSGVMLQT